MRRAFAALAALAVVASLSWIAVPMGADAFASARRIAASALGDFEPAEPAVVRAAPDEGASAQASPTAALPTPDPRLGAISRLPGSAIPTKLVLPKDDTYIWPISGAKLTTYFAPQRAGSMLLNGVPIHNGIDIARPCRWPVAAAHDGTVLAAGRRSDAFLGFSSSVQPYYDELARRKVPEGAINVMVIVDDGNGLVSVYAHLAKVAVSAGDHVVAGQLIGLEGATGNATGCHLHYSLYVADGPWTDVAPALVTKWHYPAWMRVRVDPLLYLPADSPDAPKPSAGLERPAETLQWEPPTPAEPPDVEME
jgi:murein DD-endopeptidase MepM/ murein hydrolase activator NlpD